MHLKCEGKLDRQEENPLHEFKITLSRSGILKIVEAFQEITSDASYGTEFRSHKDKAGKNKIDFLSSNQEGYNSLCTMDVQGDKSHQR